ncbi:MAG: HYR domain-containing protein, partial [Roseivirga sp.]|nr:HYR domain-containing protein [Roseivirga sp.]
TSFDCNDAGDNTVTLTVTDASGNTSTATANVTVIEAIAPTAITQDLTIQLDANGQASITAAQIDNGSSDNCDIETITIDTPDFDCNNLGPNTVTMTVTDVNGNASTATAIVTVQDQIAPVIIPQNITVDLDANGQVTISESQVYSSITDNCTVTEIFVGPLSFDCSNIGDNTVTIQAADAGGNISSTTAIVTVRDVTAPSVIAQDITVSLDANGNASVTTAQIDNGSSDNCDLTLSLNQLDFDCSDIGTNSVILTGTDASGNVATANAVVTVVDNTVPVISAQNISINLNANGNAVITESQVATAVDNCGTPNITISQASFDCTDIGDNTITVTATDANGNQSTASVVVTIVDTIAPTVVTQNVSVNLDGTGNASITVSQIDNGSYDNCDLTLTLDQLDFDCTHVGDNTVTLTGTDASGNSTSATAVVTVIDNNAVSISPTDITVALDANGMASIDASDILDNVTTECTVARYGSNNSHAIWLSKYTATNQNVKFHFDSNGGTLTQNADGTATITGTIVNKDDANDSWSVQLNLSDKRDWNDWSALGRSWKGNANTVGTNYLNWDYYEMDTHPSSPSTLTGIGSNTGKVKTLSHRPANLNYGFQVGQAANDKDSDLGMSGWFTYQNDQGNYVQGDFNLDITNCITTIGSGSCGEATIELSQTDFDCSDAGENTITITATTPNNVVTTETVTVTIIDDITPTVLAQNITVNLDNNGQVSITTAQIDNGSSDNCDLTLNLDQLDFDCSDLGANTVTLTGTDGSGNTTSATATVTIVDNIAPTVITQNATVTLDANGNASLTVAQIDNGSSDNCDLTLSLDELNFDCSDLGANTVTLTGTDASGNTASATATVTVVDNTDPVIVTQNITVDLDADGQATITENQVITSITDNCSITEIVVVQTVFDCSDIGDNIVTVQAADAAGNITTTSVTVTVRDNTAPTIITQDVSVTLDSNGNASVTIAQIDNGSSDNCNLTLSLDQLDFDCSDLGANTVTLTGTDASGNTASATATVTVVDNIDPLIVTQNITVDLDANGQATITESQVITSVTDNCSITETVVTQTAFDCSDIGDNTVTVQAADAAGNITTTSIIVTVRDNTAPTVITQNVTVTLDANGNTSVTVAQVDNGSSDNCDLTLSLDQLDFDCSHTGENTVTLTGTDASGNTASATAVVTVVDNSAVAITPSDITVALDENGMASINATDLIEGANKECTLSKFGGSGSHAIWLSQYTASNQNALFHFDSNGGKLTQLADGTATVRGTIVNRLDANDSWAVELNLTDRKSWDEWSALGRGWKGNAGNVGTNYQDWDYYVMDTNPSNPTTLTGLGSNAGKVKTLTHMPASLYYGFQVGQAANDKDTDFGLSGWFTYQNDQGNQVQGDFNMDITDCSSTISSGACGDATIEISQTKFDCTDLGANTITITATNHNNVVTTETVTVTITDDIAPTIITQDATITLDANGNASVTVAQVDNGSYDNCNLTLSLDQLNFDCSDLGANTVTLTGTDASGNMASATAIVTVTDNIAPAAIAQSVTVQLNANGQASITASQVNNGSSDNCGISTVTLSSTSFDCTNLGTNTVTLTVTDVSGNSSTTSATVTVLDNILPVITNVPADIVYQEQDANCGESISWNVPTATDNCQVSIAGSHNPGDVFPIGTTTVTYTATDNAGNTTSDSFDVTVVAAPVTVALNITQQLTCSDDEIGAIDATVNGGCGNYSYLWSNGATTAHISNLEAGTYSVTVTAGNGGTATASIELHPSSTLEITGTVSPEYPVANGGAQNTIYLGYGEQAVTLTADATGGNGPYTYEWFPENAIACTSGNSVVVAPQVNTTYTVIVTDANGCTATESFDINVVDTRCGDTNSQYGTTTNYYGRNHYNGGHGDCRHDGDNGSDAGDDCQCEGRMRNFTFVYNGVSGVTIKAYNKRYTVLIERFNNVQNGDVLTVEGYDRGGRLDSKTHLRIGSSFYEIHTSCSINILGETYGPFTITGYTDGEGSSCTLDEHDDDDETNLSCDASAAVGGGHALWLSAYNAYGNGQFFFDTNSGSFTTLSDGKAKLTGIVSNRRNANDKWQIEFYLSDAMNWSEWSGLGRSYKDEVGLAGNKYLDWSYYIMDQSQATRLVGLGDNAGQVKTLSHMPSNFYFGFQVGEAANNKNSNYGISGWFSYMNYRGQWVQGDINMDLNNCQETTDGCDTGVTPYNGDIKICLNGQSYCVDQDDVDYYLGLGATLGTCSTTQAPLSGGTVGNGEANDENELTKSPDISISAYPNPTKAVANITFSVSEDGPVSLGIYSTKGLLIGTLYKGIAEANTEYKVVYDGSNVTEGVYLIRLRTAGYLETKKLMIKK